MNFDRQNILTIVLILAIIGGGYVWYAYFSSFETGAPEIKSPVSNEFLRRASLLERLDIDTGFFRGSAFLELRSGAPPPPPPEARGRANPFGGF